MLVFMVRKLMMARFKDYPFISNRTPAKKWENREESRNPGGRERQDPRKLGLPGFAMLTGSVQQDPGLIRGSHVGLLL